MHASNLHVLEESGRCSLKIAWQAQAAKYLSRLDSMDDNKTLKQAFIADCRLPRQKCRSFQVEAQLHDVSVTVPATDGHSQCVFRMQTVQTAQIAQLAAALSSKPHPIET